MKCAYIPGSTTATNVAVVGLLHMFSNRWNRVLYFMFVLTSSNSAELNIMIQDRAEHILKVIHYKSFLITMTICYWHSDILVLGWAGTNDNKDFSRSGRQSLEQLSVPANFCFNTALQRNMLMQLHENYQKIIIRPKQQQQQQQHCY